MLKYFAAVDVVILRGGVIVILEIIVFGKLSIIVLLLYVVNNY